jgi:hypothetical protein
MRVKRRQCRSCPRLAVLYEKDCFDHLEAARIVAEELPPVAALEAERDRGIRTSDAEFVQGLGRMLAPGLALAIAHWESGPHVGVCGHGACTRTQVAGSRFCRRHGGLVR